MMKILQKKICLIGDFGVGKTSLVGRFVNNEFSDKYLTTVGVKMDTKLVEVEAELKVKLVLWDIAGDSSLTAKVKSYLRGTSGFVFVADGTRFITVESLFMLKAEIDVLLGAKPFVILINKYDLIEQWDVPQALIDEKITQNWPIFYSSAKTGENIETAFLTLCNKMVE